MTIDATGSEDPTVIDVDPYATVDDLDPESFYQATVNGRVAYGVFVDVSDNISGLVHESKLTREHDVGDTVVVSLDEIRDNGDVAFDIHDFESYSTVERAGDPTLVPLSSLSTGATDITAIGRVDQIKQTGGPTIFSITDGEHVIGCAAFESAGVRAYPAVDQGDIIHITGRVDAHEGGRQVEVDTLTRIEGDTAAAVREDIDSALQSASDPPQTDPLIDWSALDKLYPDLIELASRLRRMILESRPVRIRHHADGDGMSAAVPLAMALENFASEVHADPSAPTHLISRSPSKAPYYEMEDATRDLNQALRDRHRHGQRLPFLLMLDNGSTDEDVPAYRNLAHYDIPIGVVDHHHPDPAAVSSLLDHHINPYLHDEDYRVTTGMLCVELARLIDSTLGDRIQHVPAVAGLADRSDDEDAMEAYLELAAANGYDRSGVQQIVDAVDYAAHWLKFRDGGNVVRDLFGIGTADEATQQGVRDLFAREARSAIDEQVETVTPYVETRELANGATLHQIDVDQHAHRFRYPAPGKTTGAVHDHLVEASGDPTITMGYGPDFCVLRSDGVRLDIPAMVDTLRADLPGSGVYGGGHLVVGSIKFVAGKREVVLDALSERMAEAPLDAELTSTGNLDE